MSRENPPILTGSQNRWNTGAMWNAQRPIQNIVAILPWFSESLEGLDHGLAQLLDARDIASAKIWAYKKANKSSILDVGREEIVKNDMWELLRVKAHSVRTVGEMRNHSDLLWDSIMRHSRNIQLQSEPNPNPDPAYSLTNIRWEIDTINRSIIEIVAVRMRLFQDQLNIPGYWLTQIHQYSWVVHKDTFEALDQLCMATRWVKIPLGVSPW